MFDKEIYKKRRSVLKEKVGTGLILFIGNEEVGMNYAANSYHFRQDSTFLYYTGIDLPGLAFIIDIDEDKEILFGNELTIDDIVWTGPLDPLTAWADKAGITITKAFKEIDALLKAAKAAGKEIHFLPPYRGRHVLRLQEWLGYVPSEIETQISEKLIKSIVSMRSYKKPEEIAEMEKAVDISTEMHELFFTSLQPGITEKFVEGIVHGHALSTGNNLAYPIILTINGETLHILPRDIEMGKERLAICDAGAETSMHYAGDLTRTAPVSGKFSSIQKDIYNIVLHAQLACIEACKPGVLFRDIHALAGETLLSGLKDIGLIKGDVQEAVSKDVHTLFFQCGLGHMIGLDVHDMENLGEKYIGYTDNIKKSTAFGWKSLRLAKALEPGFTLTVEPGIYFIPVLIDLWKSENKLSQFINYQELEKFKDFGGVRVEDNVLITQGGCRILGNKIAPKTIDEIEAYIYRVNTIHKK
ncbi:MAG: Xaa-Pro aminopeptidase [Arachidicoccus sp.]|nr:Xaa-Pro aminopeptidase [Arachidicoccus sp.]